MTLTQTDVDKAVEKANGKQPERTMFTDLLAAQLAMPALQKSAINPHFKNKYVPLEELVQAVVPILNAHNFILTQSPTTLDGQPALETVLRHVSGETIQNTMLLLCAKDDPQGQGSAITYARRYSLMSLLGLAADLDDDGDKARQGMERRQQPPKQNGPSLADQGKQIVADRKVERINRGEAPHAELPKCPEHGPMHFVKAGVGKSGKPYPSFYGCERTCTAGADGKQFTVTTAAWEAELKRRDSDPDNIPFNE